MHGAYLPHLFTLGNLFCGFLALHYVLGGSFVPAAWLIILGAVLDKLDGLIARRIGRDSPFGIELDSLVDICTFGVVPAVMIYKSHLSSPVGLALAFLYLVCGVLRLARFNVISLTGGKGAYYLGLPIPVAAVCLTQFVVFSSSTWDFPHGVLVAALLVLALAALMVSPFNYDGMPDLRTSGLLERAKQGFLLLGIFTIVYDAERYLFAMVLIYIMSGIYRWVVGLFHDEVTQHA